MSFLDKITSSLLSYIPSFFSHSSSTSQKKAHIYERYPSNPKITDCFNAQINQVISQRLVPYQLRSARLSQNENGTMAFEYIQEGKQIYLCEKEEQLFQWLQKTWPQVNIWEVEDARTKNSSKLFLKIDNENIQQFQSDQALFENLYEESGDLWKLNCVEWDGESKKNSVQTVYIRAKKNWSNQIVFEKRDIDDLIYNVPEEILQTLFQNTGRQGSNEDYNPQTHTLKGFTIGLLLLTVGVTRLTQTASQVRGLAFSTFAGYGLSQLISYADAVNLYANQPNISLSLYSGQNVNLTLRNYFQDFTPPNGNTLNFMANSLPLFLQYNSISNAINNTIDSNTVSETYIYGSLIGWGGKNATWFDKNNLGIFSTLNVAPFIYGLSVSSYSSPGFGRLPVFNFAAGPDGCKNIPIFDTSFLNSIPATTNVTRVISQPDSSIFRIVDGTVIKAFNLTSADTSISLGTYDTGAPIIDLTYCNNNQWICYLNPTGLEIINSNSITPSSVGFLPITSPVGLDCQNEICYVAEPDGIKLYNITGLNPSPIAAYSSPTLPTYSATTFGGLIYAAQHENSLIDILDPTTFPDILLHSSINLNGKKPNQITVNGNTIYIATDNGIVIATVNDDRITGSPTPSDRGIHEFTIEANNYKGESVFINVTLHVLNWPVTLVNPLPYLTATVGKPFSFDISNVFSDLDDPSNTLNIIVEGLPPSLGYSPTSIEGNPESSDEGTYNITLTATDLFNTSATTSTTLQINPSTSGITPSDNGLNGGQIAGIVVGILGFLGGAGGLLAFLLHKQKKKKKVTQNAPFKFSDTTVKTKTLFGGHYATLEWDEARIQHCLQETGFRVKNELGEIDNGANGKVCICWNISENKYVAVKYVEDPTKIQQCEGEAEIQKEAAGEGVWTVHNYSIIDDKLIIVTELADLGDGDKFLDILSKSTLNQEQKQWFITYFIYKVLKGLETLSKKEINHGDLKLTNILIKKNGEIGISDFGSAQQSIDLIKSTEGKSVFRSKKSDMLFKSNEECLNGYIIPEKGDAYAIGWLAYEALSNQLLETLLAERQKIHVHELLVNIDKGIEPPEAIVNAKNALIESLEELNNPEEGSLWEVISNLLRPDPNLRWNATKALNAACFKKFRNLSNKQMAKLVTPKFDHLFNEWIKEKNTSTFYPSQVNQTQRLNHYGTAQESNQFEMKERLISSSRLDHYGAVPQPGSSQLPFSSNSSNVSVSRGSSSVYATPNTTRKNPNPNS